MSESCHVANYRGKKRRGCLKYDTSITNFDETLPLNVGANYDIIDNCDKPQTEMNHLVRETNPADRIETLDNGDVKVKINICNIQRSSKDDKDSNLSSLHIETLRNGTKLNETRHFNNNMEKTEGNLVNNTNKFALQHKNTTLATWKRNGMHLLNVDRKLAVICMVCKLDII